MKIEGDHPRPLPAPFSGKLYRIGPQSTIYHSTSKVVKNISIQSQPSVDLPPEVRKQMEEQLLKNNNKEAKTTIFQITPSDNLHTKLKEQFGEAFLEVTRRKSTTQATDTGIHKTRGIGPLIRQADARRGIDEPFKETCQVRDTPW